MKVWEMMMVKRDPRVQIEVRDNGSWCPVYVSDEDEVLTHAVGDMTVKRFEIYDEGGGFFRLVVFAK